MKYQTGISLNCVCGIGGICYNCKREQDKQVQKRAELLLMGSDILSPDAARQKSIKELGFD